MSNPQQMPQQPPMQQPPQSPMPQQMPPSGHMDHANRPTGMTVCGIVGLVLGILAFILSFIPIINNLAFVLGLVALVLAIIGLVGTMRGKKTGKVVAIIATVLSVLSLVITLAMQSAASDAIDEAFDDSTSQQTDDTDADDAADDTADDADGSALTGEGDLGDVHVRIVSAERGGTDRNGDETVVVTYEWTNNTDSSTSFMATVEDTAFQNGQELDKDFYLSDSDTYDSDSQYSDVQSGATGTVTIAYVLSDDSAVSVEVSEWLSLDDSVVTQTFELN